MTSKQDKIKKLIEMQRKFIDLEHKGEISAQAYFTPEDGSSLDGYKEDYRKLSMEVVDEAHKEKGSHR